MKRFLSNNETGEQLEWLYEYYILCCEEYNRYLTIILRNRAEHRLILSRMRQEKNKRIDDNRAILTDYIICSYANQLIKYSSDSGSTFHDITFPAGVWNYTDFNTYIKDITKIVKDGANNNEYPITLEFNETTFRVTVMLA